MRPPEWPTVAVIPARNEAGLHRRQPRHRCCRRIMPGRFSIVLVDDNSEDATACDRRTALRTRDRLRGAAHHAARRAFAGRTGPASSGRVKQGIAAANREAPDFLLLTDADIVYEPRRRALARLACRVAAATS